MSVFVLKLIGIIVMSIEHVGYIVFKNINFTTYIGRFAFPIFAFLITEGFAHTKNVKKYFLRLFIFAAISQIPYMLFVSKFSTTWDLNILFTFSLGLLMLFMLEKTNNKFIKAIIIIFTCCISDAFTFDYGWFGIATIYIFYKFKDKKILMSILFILTSLIQNTIRFFIFNYNTQFFILFIFTTLSLIFINLYNGKRGKNLKYLFYIFYPLHLTILYLISFILK